MSGKKPTARAGFLPKLKGFLEGLGDRYQRVLQVIDEALASDNLKDKIWAVDLILKRTPSVEPGKEVNGKQPAASKPADLEKLSEAELLARLRALLDDTPPEA